jgi:hypothetical protein
MPVDWRDVLLTLAEITIAIVGFSGIVGALDRDVRKDRRSDAYVLFRWMLDYSLGAFVSCLLPFLVFSLAFDQTTGWRISSALSAASFVIWAVSAREFTAEMYKRSSLLDRIFHVGDFVVLALLILNSVGVFFTPGFPAFLVSVLWSVLGAVVGFARLLSAVWEVPHS